MSRNRKSTCLINLLTALAFVCDFSTFLEKIRLWSVMTSKYFVSFSYGMSLLSIRRCPVGMILNLLPFITKAHLFSTFMTIFYFTHHSTIPSKAFYSSASFDCVVHRECHYIFYLSLNVCYVYCNSYNVRALPILLSTIIDIMVDALVIGNLCKLLCRQQPQ